VITLHGYITTAWLLGFLRMNGMTSTIVRQQLHRRHGDHNSKEPTLNSRKF